MNITQIVFSYPTEARYSYDPSAYSGGAIEDIEHALESLAPGDRVFYENRLWLVAQTEEYLPVGGHEHRFCVAIAALGGKTPKRDPWHNSDAPCLYIYVAEGEVLHWGIAEQPKDLPAIGSTPDQFPLYAVDAIWPFESATSYSQGFSRVLVCQCIPIEALAKQEVEAIAIRVGRSR